MGGMTRLLLLLWAGVVVSTAVDLEKRIIGGQPCNRPYHVKITDADNDLVCGGSLISNRWILTAAHCWQWHMRAVLAGQAQPMRITAPPVMFSDNNNRVHDIMLLQLPQQVQAPHVALPNCNRRPAIGTRVQVAGHGSIQMQRERIAIHRYPYVYWGFTRAPGESDDLHCANFDLVDCRTLRHDPREYPHLLCGRRHLTDICPGDSGGGVEWNNMIYGVNVITGDPVNACAAPAGFMDVCEYKPWIQNITGIRAG